MNQPGISDGLFDCCCVLSVSERRFSSRARQKQDHTHRSRFGVALVSGWPQYLRLRLQPMRGDSQSLGNKRRTTERHVIIGCGRIRSRVGFLALPSLAKQLCYLLWGRPARTFRVFPRHVKTASHRMQETKKYINLSAALKGKMGEGGGGERDAGTGTVENFLPVHLPIKKSREALQF